MPEYRRKKQYSGIKTGTVKKQSFFGALHREKCGLIFLSFAACKSSFIRC